MKFETFISRRFLSSHRKSFFLRFLLFISRFAVATGVFALIFVLAIMNGFENDFRRKVLSFHAPMVVTGEKGEGLIDWTDKLRQSDSRIRRVIPFVEGEAVAQSGSGGTVGVRVRGISETPTKTRLGELYESESFTEKGLLMGDELASTLRVHPDFSEEIKLIFPFGEMSPTGELLPTVRTLTLTGICHAGYYDYDSKSVVLSYEEAMRLFGDEGRKGLEVWIEPVDAAESVKKVLEKVLANRGRVATWKDQNPKLFAAMKLEKIGMFLLLTALLLISSFNIFGLTSLAVMDKVKEMAVLRSIGLTARRVRKIFLLKAARIGVVGAAIGGGLGLLTVFLLQRYPVRLPTTYYLEHLPVHLDLQDVFLVLLLVPLLTVLAALYPAIQAAKPSPVEVLRYE